MPKKDAVDCTCPTCTGIRTRNASPTRRQRAALARERKLAAEAAIRSEPKRPRGTLGSNWKVTNLKHIAVFDGAGAPGLGKRR